MADDAAVFDVKAHLERGNVVEEALKLGKEPPTATPGQPAVGVKEEDRSGRQIKADEDHSTRRDRRTENRLREEAALNKGRADMLQEMIDKGLVGPVGTKAPKIDADPEPIRADFTTDAEWYRAVGRWDARQEAAKVGTKIAEQQTQAQELETMRGEMMAAQEKAVKDKAIFEDWDAVLQKQQESEEDGTAPTFSIETHPTFVIMISRSDVKAHLAYHFAEHPDELQTILDLPDSSAKQIAAFHRLEGRLEKEYSKPKVAQAVEDKTPEQRATPEKAAQARGAESAQVIVERKPKPSASVNAPGGGSPVPDEPAPGSAAWMAKRNSLTGGR